MPLAAAPTVACPVRAVPVAVVLLASPRPPAPLGTGDVARAGGTAWCPGAAGRGGCSCLSPRPRRRRRERRVSIAPRFQLPPCLYGRGIPTGGCCEGTECAGLQGRSGLGGDGDCRAANAVALARAAPQPSPRRGVEGGRCWGSQHPAAVLWAPVSGCRSVSDGSGTLTFGCYWVKGLVASKHPRAVPLPPACGWCWNPSPVSIVRGQRVVWLLCSEPWGHPATFLSACSMFSLHKWQNAFACK